MSILFRTIQLAAVALSGVSEFDGPARCGAQLEPYAHPQHTALTMAETSWTYQKPDEPRLLKLHDLIVVTVNEKSMVKSDGQVDRKKKGYGDSDSAGLAQID